MGDWAAKVLEGVPRHYDTNCDRVILEADALAAIDKMVAGDGLVERLNRADEYEPLGHDGWEAAAHIAALTAQVAENRISEPHDPGDFVGDIFYGHPIKTTMGTHRWTGTEWVALPSEAEALAGLLAGARKEAAALRERVARLEVALRGLHHAVCGETGFAACVRLDSGKAYPWPALDAADDAARAALTDGGKDE